MPDNNKTVSIGGSVEKAIKGEYSIDVKAVLTEAWQNTLKSRISINLGLLAVLFLGMFVSYVASSFFGGIDVVFKAAQNEGSQALQMINIVVTIAIWPFIAGIEMMGISHAINKPTQSKMIFSFLHRGSWVALCALLTSLLISIGVQLFIIPGVLLTVMLSLTVPLVIDKKLSPVQAITLSIKALRFKLMPLLVIYFALFMAFILLLLPIALLIDSSLAPIGIVIFLVGISYVAPWYYNVKGVLYRDIFGVLVDQNSININEDDSTDKRKNLENKESSNNGSDDTFSA